jgi:hypothetical protein
VAAAAAVAAAESKWKGIICCHNTGSTTPTNTCSNQRQSAPPVRNQDVTIPSKNTATMLYSSLQSTQKIPLPRHPFFWKTSTQWPLRHNHCRRPLPPPHPVQRVEPAHCFIGDGVCIWFDLILPVGGAMDCLSLRRCDHEDNHKDDHQDYDATLAPNGSLHQHRMIRVS